MKITQFEKAFIKAEEKRQSRWLWVRWVNAAVSVLVVVISALSMKRLVSLIGDQPVPASVALWFWPFCCIVVLSFSVWFMYTLAHWRGNILTSLLLKLVHEHDQDHDISQES